jgi:hypothetical protein
MYARRVGLGVSLLSSTTLLSRRGGGGGEFSPASLFTAGEGGFWLDPSDLTTMWQDNQGVTPVTAPSQSVGLILDKRIGTRTQVFDDANVTFSGPAGYAGRISPGVYELAQTAAGGGVVVFGGLVSGRSYLVSLQIAAYAGAIPGITGVRAAFFNSTGAVSIRPSVSAVGTYTFFYLADGTNFSIRPGVDDRGGTISNVSILEAPGNHFLQATAAKRPILQQDAQGFYYLQGDGTDDVLNSVAAVAPLGVDKSQGFIGVYMDSNAVTAFPMGTSPSPASGGTTTPSAPGSWAIRMPSSNGTSITGWPCQGTNRNQPTFSTSTLTKYALSGLMDIAAPSIVVRRNAAEVVNSTVTMGTGTFLSYISSVLATATGFFPGRVYQAICRFGPNLDAATITQTENYVNSKTGAY